MAADYTHLFRQAGLAVLRAHAPLLALVPAARITEEVPTHIIRPYVRWGVPVSAPFEASRLGSGDEFDQVIHVFDEASDNGRLFAIMHAVREGLDDASLAISGGTLVWLDYTGREVVGDAGPQYRHGIVSFSCAVAELS